MVNNYTTTRRVARKTHYCEGTVHTWSRIELGDVYLEHKEFPGADTGFASAAGHPVRMVECAICATIHSRGNLLDPVPTEQAYRQGLV